MFNLQPYDARCRFCTNAFCCKDCREKHENNKHQGEIDLMIKQEYLKSICYMCHGQSLPYSAKVKLSEDLMEHIVEVHFPLKCDKCLKIFETLDDIIHIGKCCITDVNLETSHNKETAEIIQEITSRKRPSQIKINCENIDEDVLTPLTKINLHWRRKSKEFTLKPTIEEEVDQIQKRPITHSTSTPVPTHGTFDSITSLQYSSINYNTSSDNDFSPPQPSEKLPPPPIPSPKSIKKNLSQSRQKLQAHNTPLRQVMTKSIQKAIATHGHYKNINLQQRKMSFNSSSSGSETTVSLMKINKSDVVSVDDNCGPLDLRTSPALKRELVEKETDQIAEQMSIIPEITCNSVVSNCFGSNVDFKYEEIHVIYKTDKSSIVTNYRSCYSESTTPKIIGNNMLKKTISFESPATLEKTPDCLIPTRSNRRCYSQSDNEDDKNESEDDTVFYTPRSTPTPVRYTPLRRRSTSNLESNKRDRLAPTNIWKYMTAVVGNLVHGGSVDKDKESTQEKNPRATTSSSSSNKDNNWAAALQKPLKAAAEYFVKATHQIDDDIRAQKRRHSSTDDTKHGMVALSALSPPILKRRRIQGRKPIRRLQSDA